MQQQNKNEIVCFTMPKIGEAESDIQDAYSYNTDGNFLVAVSDGASTSFLPEVWAKLLVDHFCNPPQWSIQNIYQNWQEWLKPLQKRWAEEAIRFRQTQSEKLQQGENINVFAGGSRFKDHGSATFIGLNLYAPDEFGRNNWETLSIGDSCLFQIKTKEKKIISFESFPYNHSSNFASVTDCFHSLAEYNSSYPNFNQGFYETGDIFLLATDALAEWILKNKESNSKEWMKLLSITEGEFTNFIQQLRGDKLIKDDDTTLCRVKISSIPKKKPVNSQLSLPPTHPHSRKHKVHTNVSDPVQTNIKPLNQDAEPGKSLNKIRSLLYKRITWVFITLPIVLIVILFFLFLVKSKDQQPHSNISTISSSQLIPIYLANNSSEGQPIGYLLRKPLDFNTDFQVFLVHAPASYIKDHRDGTFELVFPDNHSLALYEHIASASELSPQNFIGYLSSGTFPIQNPKDPKDPLMFRDTRWVEIQVRVGK